MKKRQILTDPNPILRKETQRVEVFDGEIQEIIDDMIFTMRSADGIGLAAPQIGESKKIVVVEYDSVDDKEKSFPLTVLVNPKIVQCSNNEQFMAEGCLSFPGKELRIKRPETIRVSACDRWGKDVVVEASGLFSRALQHEIDHINGVLMIDQVSVVNVVFVGNGTLGIPSLELLISNPQYNLLAVYTSVDKKSGRKKVITETEIAKFAKTFGLNPIKINTIKSPKVVKEIKNMSPDLIILVDYCEIFPEDIIEIPKLGVINIHPSMLPKYRGPSPVVSAILNGDKKTGVSIIKINKKVDSGDILAQIETKIRPRENAVVLKSRLAELGADLLAELVPYYQAGEISPIKQSDDMATSSVKLAKDDGFLLSQDDAITIDRKVRALNPWPGTYVIRNGKRIFITKTHLSKDGKLIIDLVKPEGKKEMKYADYLNGYHDELTFSK